MLSHHLYVNSYKTNFSFFYLRKIQGIGQTQLFQPTVTALLLVTWLLTTQKLFNSEKFQNAYDNFLKYYFQEHFLC